MKMNMRKLLALLATVAMLLTVLPLGALFSLAVGTNLVANGDFETGTTNKWSTNEANTFEIVENVGGSGQYSAYIEYNVDWGNIYQGLNVAKNTDYVFTYRVKGEEGFSMISSVQGSDWKTSLAKQTKACTGDWMEFSVEFNSGDFDYIIVYVQSTHEANAGHKVYVDDISVTEKTTEPDEPDEPDEPEEPEEPETTTPVINGDFETGDVTADGGNTGWRGNGVAEFTSEANYVHGGNYALLLKATSA